ncbi:MAG: translocation/assembly module TamB domain-containing protein [Woeseiaceae bacterium]
MRRRILIGFTLLLVLLIAGSWRWLLHTESGARWIWARAQSASEDSLLMHSLDGDLGSGLTVRGIVFTTETMVVEVAELRFVANLNLLPPELRINELRVDAVTVQLSNAAAEVQTDQQSLSLEPLSSPLLISVNDSFATNIAVTTPAASSAIEVQQVGFAGSWHDAFVVDHLNVQWANSSAEITGELHMQPPYFVTVDGRLNNIPVPGEPVDPLDLHLQLDGDLAQLDLDAAAKNVDLWVRGSLANLLAEPSWELQAGLANATLRLPESDTSFAVTDLKIGNSGSLAGSSHWNLQLSSDDLDVTGTGELNWADAFSMTANLDLTKFRISKLLDNWPSGHLANGDLSLELSKEQLTIDESWLAVEATETMLNVDALIELATSTTEGNLRWRNFVWPASDGGETVVSDSGSVTVSGSLDDWRVTGDVALQSESIPPGRFQVDGSGDRDRMQANIIKSQILGGTVAGAVGYTWRDDRAWSATLQTSDLELTALNPRWPSNVSGRINANGTRIPLLSDVTLEAVSGDLWALPIIADGRLVLTEHNVVAQELRVEHGETRIELDGDLRSEKGVEFDASVHDASLYLVDANGAIDINGQFSLNENQPFIDISGVGSDLGFGPLQANSIEIRNRAEGDCPINTEVVVPELLIGDNAFADISVVLCGDQKQQEITLQTTYDVVNVQLSATGGFDNFAAPERWLGELRQFAITLDSEPAAALSAPVDLSLSADLAILQRTCLLGNSGMQLCAALDWEAGKHFEFDSEMTDMPLAFVNQFIPTKLRFNQSASGQLHWSSGNNKDTDGKADISLTAGSIVSTANSEITIPTDPGKLFLEVVDGRSLTASAALPMPGFGRLDASLAIPDINQGSDGAIEGSIDVELSDMALFAAVIPIVNEAHGQFNAGIEISGSLASPRLVGDFAVVDGSLALSPLGLQLRQINLESTLYEDGQMELTGKFMSGDGQAEIFTRSDYASTGAKGFELELRGQNLTLIDVPDIKAFSDLDLRVTYDYQQLGIGGNILIPHARVMASNLAAAQDTESEDVVIVAGELPEESEARSSETDLVISGSVGIALGEDVSIDLGLATANITGSTLFTWDNNLIPIADGRYDLTGAVQAFGQMLEITEGGLRFPKISADNPFVRLRAEREIYGNSQVKTAGILVDGTLRQFSVEAYTRPATTEERALTLLVTGSDFDFEQGVGAIDFGTYIAPKVFVSYGVGLFETENVIRVRYDLKRGFGVTASSGEKESGFDLSYRIER